MCVWGHRIMRTLADHKRSLEFPTRGFLSILLFSKDNVQAAAMLVPVDTEGQAMLNEK